MIPYPSIFKEESEVPKAPVLSRAASLEAEVPRNTGKDEIDHMGKQFFQMCLLSFKMNNQDLEEVLEWDHSKLYTKCVEQYKKFFHEF